MIHQAQTHPLFGAARGGRYTKHRYHDMVTRVYPYPGACVLMSLWSRSAGGVHGARAGAWWARRVHARVEA